MDNHSRKKMRLLAIKLASLQQELQISKQILQSAAREVDTMFKEKYFPEVPVTPEPAQEKEQPIVEKREEQDPSLEKSTEEKHQQSHFEEQEIKEIDREEKNPQVKKLFRQIALKIHPDKLVGLEDGFEKSKKQNCFKEPPKPWKIMT